MSSPSEGEQCKPPAPAGLSNFLGLPGFGSQTDNERIQLLQRQREAAARASAGLGKHDSGFRSNEAYRAMIDTFRSHGSTPTVRKEPEPAPASEDKTVVEEVVVKERPPERRQGPKRFQNPPLKRDE